MAYLNDHYLKLKAGYLFPEIARRVKAFCDANQISNCLLIPTEDHHVDYYSPKPSL